MPRQLATNELDEKKRRIRLLHSKRPQLMFFLLANDLANGVDQLVGWLVGREREPQCFGETVHD
jgi:hypothetical protein